jgi:hypothetical protein
MPTLNSVYVNACNVGRFQFFCIYDYLIYTFGAPLFFSTYKEALFTVLLQLFSAIIAYLNFSIDSTVSEEGGNKPGIVADFLLKVRATITTIGYITFILLYNIKGDQAREFRLRVFYITKNYLGR